jgi:hypothetical protein
MPNTADFFANQVTIKNVNRGMFWHHVWRITPATRGMADLASSMTDFGQSNATFVVDDRDGNPIIVQYNLAFCGTNMGPDPVESLGGIYGSRVECLPERTYQLRWRP